MKLICQLSDLHSVSGGYTVDEFVTENTIFYNSLISALYFGVCMGALGLVAGSAITKRTGAIIFAGLGTGMGAYIGYNFNEYSNIEPNTWVTWNIIL